MSEHCSEFNMAPWQARWDSLKRVMDDSIKRYCPEEEKATGTKEGTKKGVEEGTEKGTEEGTIGGIEKETERGTEGGIAEGTEEGCKKEKPFPRQQTLCCLMRRLKAFSKGMICYLKNISETEWEAYREYPREYAMEAVLDQIGHDIEVIQRAAAQRIAGSPAMLNTLRVADYLAWEALRPALEGTKPLLREKEGDPTTVLTYFHKSANIRVIPYAPIALVGIPFTCVPRGEPPDVDVVAQDFLAIPHEVGHHIYWRSQTIQDDLLFGLWNQVRTKLLSVRLVCFRWIEEIFADVYGCAVAGPWAAQGFHDIALTNTLEQFFSDDREHPVPAIRPYIYAHTLAWMNNPEWATEVWHCWNTHRGERVKDWKAYRKGKCELFPEKRVRLQTPVVTRGLLGTIVTIVWEIFGRAYERVVGKGAVWVAQKAWNSIYGDFPPPGGTVAGRAATVGETAWNPPSWRSVDADPVVWGPSAWGAGPGGADTEILGAWNPGDWQASDVNYWWGETFPVMAAGQKLLPDTLGDDKYEFFAGMIRDLFSSPLCKTKVPDLACDCGLLGGIWDEWLASIEPELRIPRDPLNLKAIQRVILRRLGEDARLTILELIKRIVLRILGRDEPSRDLAWPDVVHAKGWTTKGPQDGWHSR